MESFNLDVFAQRLRNMHQRVSRLNELAEVALTIQQQQELTACAFEELAGAKEELEIANEYLFQQNQALAAERQRYRELFEGAPDGYLVTDTRGTIQEANRAAATLLNIPQQFLVGKPLSHYIAPSERSVFCRQINRLPQIEQKREWDTHLQPRQQVTIPVAVTVTAIQESEGTTVGWRWLLRDISDRKQAQESLQQLNEELELRVRERTAELEQANARLRSEIAQHQQTLQALQASQFALSKREQEFKALVENAPDVIERFDRSLRHVYVNPAIEQATGKPPAEFIGKTNRELEMPESKTLLWEKALETVFQTAQEAQIEFSCPSPSGQRYYQTRLVPEFATNGTAASESDVVETVLAISRDISQRKQAEAEVFKALEAERELNQLKSSFVAMTSHEFRTPLTTIQASTEMLERYRQRLSEEKQRNHFHRISAAVERMTEMLNDVLILSQAEAGKLKFQPAPLDLGQFCRSLVEDFRANGNDRPEIVWIEREIAPPPVPPPPQMDEKLLRHILSNLLANALKYSPAESTVEFELICDRDRARFRIQDRGIGIPPQDLAHLFESFRRATNVGNIQGTGLGLAIVKRCADLHGGEIQVESEVGRGTTFTVTLPLNCP